MEAAGRHRQSVRTSARNLAANARLVGAELAVYLCQGFSPPACCEYKSQRQLGETPTTEQMIHAGRAAGQQDHTADQKELFLQPLSASN